MAAALTAWIAAAPLGASAAQPAGEYDVKAAMLVNVMKFIEQPAPAPGASSAGLVCTLGAQRFAAAFADAATRAGAPMKVRAIRSAVEATGCAVAMLGPDEPPEGLEELAGQLAAAGVLTVGETDGHGARGVLVNFVLEGERIRFEINLGAARRAGVRFSSKLLRLARVVGASA